MAVRLARLLRHPVKRQAPLVPDEELVARIQQSDQEAWALFLERYTDLIYTRAWEYSQAAKTWLGAEDQQDEVADLYLFMASAVQRSLKSFRGACKPSTWVFSVLNNRRQILKGYLLHKDPGRAEVRLPQVLKSRPEIDQEIFKRLVWGLDPIRIAHELEVPESQCAEVEGLLADHSPRVYARIQANRQTQKPRLALDQLQIASEAPDPAEHLERQELEETMHQILSTAFQGLSTPERRVLVLLYDQDFAPAEVAVLAAADPNLGLAGITEVPQVYYLKDKALGKLVDALAEHLKKLEDSPPAFAQDQREGFRRLEALLRERGIPLRAG